MRATRRDFLTLAALGPALLAAPGAARAAAPLRLTDIAGREVTVNAPVRRMILGEGRQTYAVAALDRDNPFARVVGWRDDFRKADFDGYS